MSSSRRHLPSKADLKKLPPRAVVAYAARCARRVLPLYNIQHLRYARSAVGIAEKVGTRRLEEVIPGLTWHEGNKALVGLGLGQSAAGSALKAARALEDGNVTGVLKHAVDALDAADLAIANIANIVAQDAYKSVADSAGSDATADAAYGASYKPPRDAMLADFTTLCSFLESAPTDDVSFPPDLFGPLWQDNPPTGWPRGEDLGLLRLGIRQAPGIEYDVFISHATEDKDEVARPLANELASAGLRVWYDEFELRIGDSLRKSIDTGVAKSRFGVVVLSVSFFAKNWPQYELDSLVTLEMAGQQSILPIWHRVTKQEVLAQSPALADKIALSTSIATIEEIAKEIVNVIQDSI